jgi:hypothetical protein
MAEPKTPKKGGILSKKIAGIPAPVVLVVGGVLAYYLYTKYKGGSSSSTTPTDTSAQSQPGYGGGDTGGGSGGGSGGGGSPPGTPSTNTATGTDTGTGFNYTGTGTTNTDTSSGNTTPPIFDTAQPGNPYGAGVAYVEPGVGDLPPGVLPVAYTPPNTTTLSAASGALASNPAQGGHSL